MGYGASIYGLSRYGDTGSVLSVPQLINASYKYSVTPVTIIKSVDKGKIINASGVDTRIRDIKEVKSVLISSQVVKKPLINKVSRKLYN